MTYIIKHKPTPDDTREINPNLEGLTHIRVDQQSNSFLGKALSPEHPAVFYHPEFGIFLSISSMAAYLSTKQVDENLRSLTGMDLVNYMQENGLESNPHEAFTDRDTFKILKSAVVYRLLSKPEILEAFIKNDLPFHVYRIKDGIPQPKHQWLQSFYNHIHYLFRSGKMSTADSLVKLLNDQPPPKSIPSTSVC